ncbi:MAG: bifunctional oligoribonuclease/PAP phosphatase NrnA [Sphingobacteriales bacterium]|nr:MAG: bifunctional oligoribonuclease/PAP phosphatase NrnA [Sphingobacteriales bacterium]
MLLPISEIFPQLAQPRRILIVTHYRPDGDAVGSLLGLTHYLRGRGHEVTPVVPSEVPAFLKWMPGTDTVLNYEAHPHPILAALKEAEIVFCLDLNDLARTQGLEQPLREATQPKVLIDHHMFPKPDFYCGMSIPEKSSTCEMVYDFIQEHGGGDSITLEAAQCLYTGLLTDTGAFRFPATTASVHRMVADLKDRGLQHTPIHEDVFDAWSFNRMRFLGFALSDRMEVFPKQKAGLIAISKKDAQLFNLGPGDTEGLVNYPLSISGIRFSVLITERPGEVRMSFRSKGDFDVNEFARLHFGGGGHFNASGGKSTLSFAETVAKFKALLNEHHPN